MELEFGQAIVPGKHAKRDREQQPEFPRAESTQDEQKQAQRTDMTFDERKEQITALRQSADNAQAFKNGLEETGYVLAKGDRRGFVVIDEQGEVFSLSKHVGDLKDKAFKEFMSPIDRDQLPSVDEAKALQQDRALSARQHPQETVLEKQPPPAPPPEDQQPKRTGEALRALKAQLAAMKTDAGSPQEFRAALENAGYVLASGDRGYTVVDENGGAYNLARQLKLKLAEINEFMAPIDLKTLPSVDEAKALQRDRDLNAEKPALEASKFLSPELAEKIEPPAPAPAKAEEPRSAEYSTVQPPPPAPETPVQPPPQDAELEALKKAIAESQAKDAQKWADFNALELRQLEYDLTRMNDGKAEDFDAIQAVEMKALKDRQKERRTGIKGFLDAMQSKLNPALAAEKRKERLREVAQLKATQAQERKDYLALIEQTKQLEIENLQERHALQRSVREHKNEEDQERFIKEHHDAKRILAEIEAQRIKDGLKHNDSLRDGPPPPKMGK
jgi:PAS domain-containing protein